MSWSSCVQLPNIGDLAGSEGRAMDNGTDWLNHNSTMPIPSNIHNAHSIKHHPKATTSIVCQTHFFTLFRTSSAPEAISWIQPASVYSMLELDQQCVLVSCVQVEWICRNCNFALATTSCLVLSYYLILTSLLVTYSTPNKKFSIEWN